MGIDPLGVSLPVSRLLIRYRYLRDALSTRNFVPSPIVFVINAFEIGSIYGLFDHEGCTEP